MAAMQAAVKEGRVFFISVSDNSIVLNHGFGSFTQGKERPMIDGEAM
jgi:hypothetical protein